MGLLLTTVAALVVWIVLIALEIKPFDALLVSLAMILIATCAHVLSPYLPGNRRDSGDTGYTPR